MAVHTKLSFFGEMRPTGIHSVTFYKIVILTISQSLLPIH